MKTDLKNMTIKEMEVFVDSLGEKKFRAKQIFQWIYRGAYSFDEMTDLSKELRDKLKEEAELLNAEILNLQVSQKDGTRKYLLKLSNGSTVESVFMKYKYGNSICVSSQVGCRMGCNFCASALGGFEKNLNGSDMINQIIAIEKDTGEKIGNIVVMGTGEPFDNYFGLTRFIQLAHAKEGLNIGLRSITVSTCGLIPKIKEFSRDFPQVNLAISLHAPNDSIRNQLMPINKKHGMEELLETCKLYADKTKRRITFEYALINSLNDQAAHAEELSKRLKGMMCHVNLIPLNNVTESRLKGSDATKVEKFRGLLEKQGVSVTVRRELGGDIDGACGQLRANVKKI